MNRKEIGLHTALNQSFIQNGINHLRNYWNMVKHGQTFSPSYHQPLTDHVLSVEDWVSVPPVGEHDSGVGVLVVLGRRVGGKVGDGVLQMSERYGQWSVPCKGYLPMLQYRPHQLQWHIWEAM